MLLLLGMYGVVKFGEMEVCSLRAFWFSLNVSLTQHLGTVFVIALLQTRCTLMMPNNLMLNHKSHTQHVNLYATVLIHLVRDLKFVLQIDTGAAGVFD